MIAEFISKGFLAGLLMAMVIGPITILCIQKTLSQGFKTGFLAGLGSSIANGIYSMLAGAGLAQITGLLIAYQGIASGISGFILTWFGVMTFRTLPIKDTGESLLRGTPIQSFISAFIISLTNPMTIILFISFYTEFEKNSVPSGYDFVIPLAVGTFFGSVVWWLALSTVIEKVRLYLSKKLIQYMNQLAGISLLILAFYAFFKTYQAT